MYTAPEPEQTAPQAALPPTAQPVAPQISATSAPIPPPLSRTDLWAMWVGAAVAGVVLAVLVNNIVSRILPDSIDDPFLVSSIFGAISGALIGLAEWFVLRRYLPTMPAWFWPAATAGGTVFGYLFYYLFPITQSGFTGLVGCFSGLIITLLVGPLKFLTKSAEGKPVIGFVVLFLIGMISLGLDKVISPAVEGTITGSNGLYTIAQTVANSYILGALTALGQWLALRLYVPRLKWWIWVLAGVVGGAFAGLVRGVTLAVFGFESRTFVPNLIITMVSTALIAIATGFVLIRVLPPAPAPTPQIAPAPPA